jgi:diguanylate cyclase (GGDEF)-like protein
MRNMLYLCLVFEVAALALFTAGGMYRNPGVPVALAVAAVATLWVMIRKRNVRAPGGREPPTPESPVIQQVQKTVEESLAGADFSVIGTEYRNRKRREFETRIDEILDHCIKLIHAHLCPHTTAIFFPTADGGYKIRKFLSASDTVNCDAVIYPGIGVIGSFIKNGLKRLRLNDIVTDSVTLFYYRKDTGIRSLMASPIVAGGMERGVIIVDSTSKDHFSDDGHAYLSAMADLCGTAILHSYLYNQHRLDHERLVAMSSTEKYFFQERSIDGVLDKLVEMIPFAFHCDRLSISLLDGDNLHAAAIKRAWGEQSEPFKGFTFSPEDKSLANIVYSKNLCLYRNFSTDRYEIRYRAGEHSECQFRSFLAYPLGVDHCTGMVLLESLHPDTYSESSRDLLSRLLASASVAIEKMRLLQQTENLAIRDGLTSLYNHRQFQILLKEAITRSLRCKKPLALAICDIDHFKKVNDTYGHRFGDTVLKAVAGKLQASIREGIDDAARYGGEEFTLILAETDAHHAVETIDRIRAQIAQLAFQNPMGKEMHVTVSFGIAVYGVHAKNQELLISHADKALYRAKESGRNRVELYYDVKEKD